MTGPATRPDAVERVARAAAEGGVHLEVVEYPDGTRTAEDAAAAVGCEVAQIVKSLVFAAGDEPLLALVAGHHRLDPARLARLAGVDTVGRAHADVVRSATGFAIGGVPPFGHARPLRCWVDVALFDHEVVWAAAGTPRHVFPIAPDVLVEISGGTVAELAE